MTNNNSINQQVEYQPDFSKLKSSTKRALRRAFLKLPPISGVIQKIMTQISNPSVGVQQISITIEQDQVLAARVLRLVNSPFFGLERQVTSIKQAVILLGFNTVKQLLLSFGVNGSFKKLGRNINFDMDRFWDHSLVTALIARKISTSIPDVDIDSAFTAGLLHDIGMVVLYMAFTKEYEKLMKVSFSKPYKFFIDTETEYFGINHAETGYLLGSSWNFPFPILQSILHHHDILSYKQLIILKNIEVNPSIMKIMEIVALADQISSEIYHGINELSSSNSENWENSLIYGYCAEYFPPSIEFINSLKQDIEDLIQAYHI